MNEDRFHDFTDGNFSYLELETFGEMMMDLPNICSEPSAEDMSSADIIRQLARVACEFEKEWLKMTDSEHEEAGEDWLDEVAKLAKWVKEHLYDVLHNEIEYGMYRAKKRVWGYTETYRNRCLKEKLVSGLRNDAVRAMLDDAMDQLDTNLYGRETDLEFHGKSGDGDPTPTIRVRIGFNVFEYKLISKFEEMRDENV